MTSIRNGREKGEARQIVADFGSKGLVRLTTQGTAYSGMKPGRTPGIGNMPFTGKMETAQAGMPSDQPIGAAFAVDFNGWRADNQRVRCISVGLSCLFPVEGMEKRQREKGRTLPCV